MKKVAIFDVDGTIFRSSLLIELVEVMIKRELFISSSRKRYEREQKIWQDREGFSQQGDYEAYIGKVVEVFVKNIKGVTYSDFKDAVKEVMAEHQSQTYRYTRDLVKELKDKGYYLLAISQSPKGILDEFCKKYGFDKVYGRFYELGPSDQFTGNVIDEHLISNKANILKRGDQSG
jgi:HAD superfamily phosphoserine phosphatase-like hydrolase